MDVLDMLTEAQLYDRLESEKKRMARLRELAVTGKINRQGYDASVAKIDAYRGELDRRGLPEARPQSQFPF
jgi:hypothetical protein